MHRVNLRFKTGFFPKIVAVRFDTRHYRKKVYFLKIYGLASVRNHKHLHG